MSRTRQRLTGWLAAAAGLVAAVLIAGCGSQQPTYSPTDWGPTYGGVLYCGYVVSPLECTGHPGVPVLMPLTAPGGYHDGMSNLTDISTALFLWHLTYHDWYASPAYYNRYVPANYRSTYTKVYVLPFDSRYRSAEQSAAPRGVYRDSKGRTVPASKVNLSKLSAPKVTPRVTPGRSSQPTRPAPTYNRPRVRRT